MKEIIYWLKRLREMVRNPLYFDKSAYEEMFTEVDNLIARLEKQEGNK